MAPGSLGSGTISFGLVSILVKLFPAAVSERVSFNLLHGKCGSRIKYQTFCPVCDKVVDRSELVKGYEFAKELYVRVSRRRARGPGGRGVEGDRHRGVRASGDGRSRLPGQGLLSGSGQWRRQAVSAPGPRAREGEAGRSGPVHLARQGEPRDIRSAQEGLLLHTMYFHDEVRDFREIDEGKSAKFKDAELGLAMRLIDELSDEEFDPKRYEDEYRRRVLAFVEKRAEGQEVSIAPARTERGKVIDLMDALKQSLGRRRDAWESQAKRPAGRKDLAKASKRAAEASPKPEKKRARAARR
jgi:DNA end-binding protein Ku